MQHYSCDIAPVCTYRIRVKQAQIRDDVLFVVNGQYGIGGRGIGDIGIKRRLLHEFSRNRSLIDQLCFWLLGIMMTAKPSSSHLTIRDVVRPPPKADHTAAEWQAAMEALILEHIPPASNRGDSQRSADERVWRP